MYKHRLEQLSRSNYKPVLHKAGTKEHSLNSSHTCGLLKFKVIHLATVDFSVDLELILKA